MSPEHILWLSENFPPSEFNQQHDNQVTCICGAIIPDENIDKQNCMNEQGEDYGEVTANRNKCGAQYETWQWGEFDDFEDAKNYLQKHINENQQHQ